MQHAAVREDRAWRGRGSGAGRGHERQRGSHAPSLRRASAGEHRTLGAPASGHVPAGERGVNGYLITFVLTRCVARAARPRPRRPRCERFPRPPGTGSHAPEPIAPHHVRSSARASAAHRPRRTVHVAGRELQIGTWGGALAGAFSDLAGPRERAPSQRRSPGAPQRPIAPLAAPALTRIARNTAKIGVSRQSSGPPQLERHTPVAPRYRGACR